MATPKPETVHVAFAQNMHDVYEVYIVVGTSESVALKSLLTVIGYTKGHPDTVSLSYANNVAQGFLISINKQPLLD